MTAPSVGALPRHGPLLSFVAADLGYGSVTVLREVGFTVHSGDFWAVVGRNGTGKSTLLRTIVGELAPLLGTLDRHDELTVGRRLAWVPQRVEINLVLPSTVREFAGLGLAGLGLARSERQQRLEAALATVGLSTLERADVQRLSGGQRQRCLLARALVRRPLLLVLDEPTAGLDAGAEADFYATLVALHRQQALSVILVTHDLDQAHQLATHVAVCADGGVRCGPAGLAAGLQPPPRARDGVVP